MVFKKDCKSTKKKSYNQKLFFYNFDTLMNRSGRPVSFVLTCLVCFSAAFLLSTRFFNDRATGWKSMISSDGKGYYAYLPAFITYGDPSFRQVVEAEDRETKRGVHPPEYLGEVNGHAVNKYFAGVALLLAPFYLLASLLTWLTGLEMNGYSFYFQLFTGIGALFYLFAGLWFLRKLLARFAVRPEVAAITLAVIVLGTNLFYYALWQPSMSHIYSFFAVNGFLWFAAKTFDRPGKLNHALAGLFLGIVFLIRPTNLVVILLLPLVAGDLRQTVRLYGTPAKGMVRLAWFLVPLVLVAVIQPLLWYRQAGEFLLWSYRDEGFNWTRPEVMNVLFSFRKGLFIYTPLAALALAGLWPLWKTGRLKFLSVVLFLATATWIIASWWNWYYGDSFGLRPFIDYYGVFGILLGLLLSRFGGKAGFAAMLLILVPVVFLNLFQTWQYTMKIIHPFNMNREKYGYVFLRGDSLSMNGLGGNEELARFTTDLSRPCRVYFHSMEKPLLRWKNDTRRRDARAFSGKFTGLADSLHAFTPGLFVRADSVSPVPSRLFLSGSVMVRDSVKGASNGAFLVLSIDSAGPGRKNFWYGFKLNDIPSDTFGIWRRRSFAFNLPEITNPKAMIQCYIWNPGGKPFTIDNYGLWFYREKTRKE